jgi:hypothetical protein
VFNIILVTTNANHTLCFKTKERATEELRSVEAARRDMKATNFWIGSDDFGTVLDIDLVELKSVQLNDVAKELEANANMAVLQMRAEVKKAELINSDPGLRELQARAAARSKLMT